MRKLKMPSGVLLYMPKEESFLIPTGCIVGENVDDYWNVDGERELSDAWTGFTRFILLNERPPDGNVWSGERLTRKQTTSRLDDVWPDLWKHMSDAAKKKAKQKWATEKPKLDNARRLRGIFFFELDEEEFKRIMQAARRNVDRNTSHVFCHAPCTCVYTHIVAQGVSSAQSLHPHAIHDVTCLSVCCLFVSQEREDPASRRQAYHSHEESLLPAQSFFCKWWTTPTRSTTTSRTTTRKIGIFVKLIWKVSMRWKNWSDFKVQHSIQFRWEKLVEDRDTILGLTAKIQELQKWI